MKTERVIIITLFYKNYNYGGILQAYALQKYISQMGYFCEVMKLDRFTAGSKRREIINHVKKRIKHVIGKNVFNDDPRIADVLQRKRDKFDSFIKSNVHQTRRVYNCWNVKRSLSLYDTFICGSDQVWSPVSGCNETFLTFVPDDKKKIAYAASIGADQVSDSYLEYMKPLISRMNAISVREQGAKDIVDSILDGKICEVMIDPTMLLTIDQWNQIMIPVSKLESKPYTLLYFIGEDGESWEKAYELAKDIGLVIVNIPYNKMMFTYRDYENKSISDYDIGPAEFLWLIKNAQYILTDSFHGIVFSTIFQKKYKFFVREKENENGSMNGRLISLLDMFHLPQDAINGDADYEKMNNILAEQRKIAFEFLSSALAD